ncbi:MAG: TonB family protein [Verrucomicrobia bacterium]|nr:TonB family protein [Verrucomicrobiota bacterium]
MSRLQKKCFLASAALHGLLLAILLLGPAFLQLEKPGTESRPLLTVIPRKLIDDALSGGGEPATKPQEIAQPTAPAPPVTKPLSSEVSPVAEVKPEPPPKVEKQIETVEHPVETTPKQNLRVKPKSKPKSEKVEPIDEAPPKVTERTAPLKKKPDVVIDLKPGTRNNEQAVAQKAKAEAKAQAEAQARSEKAAREAWQGTLGSLRKNLTGPSTTIQTLGGTGGEAYADYGQAIKTLYTEAWTTPNDVTDEKATVKVEITVARDGRIISSRITGFTKISSLDNSVQRVLDRVRRLPPFPDGAKDLQRSFELNFNLKAKRSLG